MGKYNEVNIIIESYQNKLVGIINSEGFVKTVAFIRKIFDFKENIKVAVYDRKNFLKETGLEVPDWVVGMDYNQKIVLFEELFDYQEDYISKILIHEFVHCIMGSLNICIPLFLYEGLAMYFAGQSESRPYNLKMFSSLAQLDYNTPDFYAISYTITRKFVEYYSLDKVISMIKTNEKNNVIEVIEELWKGKYV